MRSTIVVGTPGYIAPENAYTIVQSRKSDVYGYGILLLELITRKKVVVPALNDEEKVTHLVSWARSVWRETGKIECIADSYLAREFSNSEALTKQVTTMFLLALQCTERDRWKRPIMKDIIGLFKMHLFKRCDEEEYGDAVAAHMLPNIPFVSIDHNQHGECSREAAQRQREVTFNMETDPVDYFGFWLDTEHEPMDYYSDFGFWQDTEHEPMDYYSDSSFWHDVDQFLSGFGVEDDWNLIPTICIDGLLVKLMGNGKIMAEKLVKVAALNVPKVTYVWPSLIFLPSVVGPIVTKPFNWFFLSCWGQYMHLQQSLYYQPKSYFINANKINALQDLILEATDNLNDQYIIAREAHCLVYKVILGQQVFALKKFEFGRNKQTQLSIMCNEIEVLGMFEHRNLIKYTDYWIGVDYGFVLYKFMESGSLHDILHEKKPPPPLIWSDRFNIAVGIAKGLAHLHYNCSLPIMHENIKSMNILLDANMEPSIADFGTRMLQDLSEDSYSHCETGQMFSLHVIGTPGYIAPENANAVTDKRKSDVYSYGVVLLELITRKKAFAPYFDDETKETSLVCWARSIWLETGKIDKIVDSYLASSFPNSVELTKQVTSMFLLALQCTVTDLRKRPTMKDVIELYKSDLCKWRCGEVEDGDAFVANTTLQPYSTCNIFSDVPVVSIDDHLRGEVTFNMDTTEPRDNSDFGFWQDAYDWDDWKLMSKPAVGIHGLVIQLMGKCKTEVKTVVVAALIVPKITYSQPCLIYLPSITGPTLTQLFNWFFLSQWGQYMYQQKSLYYQPRSYFIHANHAHTDSLLASSMEPLISLILCK